MKLLPHERLAQRKKAMQEQLGIRLDYHNLYRLGLDQELIDDLTACLESTVVLDITKGLYFLSGLLYKYKLDDFGSSFKSFLIRRIGELIDHSDLRVKYRTISIFAFLSSNFPDYRKIMMGFLAAEDLGLRQKALYHYETFCRAGEIEPLLRFEQDDYAGELGMLGDYFYELRDMALNKIEKQLGRSFPKRRLSQPYDGRTVSWYDWKPFLEWWKK